MKLGVFGGTFNPIHNGHIRAAEEVRTAMNLDMILFVPSGNPPLKSSDIADAKDRFAMTEIAINSIKQSYFGISDIELNSKGKSFTVDTVQTLLRRYHDDSLYLIVGLDAFLDLPNWYRPKELISLIDLIVMSRPGLDVSDLTRSPLLIDKRPYTHNRWHLASGKTLIYIAITPYNVSSTQIRHLVKLGRNIQQLVPVGVAEYIAAHRLYCS